MICLAAVNLRYFILDAGGSCILLLVISFSLRAGKRAGQKNRHKYIYGYLCYNKMPGIKVPSYDTGGIR